ncbi:hypothetical protein [uncultured Varibaculum sp.]|uniref:hypothetical protein n=1 Tax=uncultured Varibaculum sp. TaxID=413896 RepID=UPI0025947462|nr:hypothetical protein [uncultured Varibaculum sp.]
MEYDPDIASAGNGTLLKKQDIGAKKQDIGLENQDIEWAGLASHACAKPAPNEIDI